MRAINYRVQSHFIPTPSKLVSFFSASTYRMASTLPNLEIFQAIAKHDPDLTAVIHSVSGCRFTYGELLGDVAKMKDELHAAAGKDSIDGERVAFLVENSYDYVGATSIPTI